MDGAVAGLDWAGVWIFGSRPLNLGLVKWVIVPTKALEEQVEGHVCKKARATSHRRRVWKKEINDMLPWFRKSEFWVCSAPVYSTICRTNNVLPWDANWTA